MWETILDHWHSYSITPTVPTLRDILPGVTILDVTESYEYILDAFCAFRTRGLTVEMIQDASSLLDSEDIDGARRLLTTELAKIEDQASANITNDVDLTETVEERIDHYLSLRGLKDGMRGIPTGFPTIDKATLGLQPQQLVTVVATPKVGKSTLAEAIAKNVWLEGFSPLLISFEMSNEEQSTRIDAMMARLAHSKLLSGKISDQDEKKLRLRLEKMNTSDVPFNLIADPSSTSTVFGVDSKIETYDPDVVFIDGVYLMRDEVTGEHNTPAALTNITRSLKRTAQKRKIPIVIFTQALTWKTGRGGKLTGDSIGYSSSFFQDSDVIMGLQHVDADDEDNQEERLLRIIAARSCPQMSVTLIWDWNTGTFEEYSDE